MMWPVLKDNPEVEYDCSESNSSFNENVRDDESNSEEDTDDSISSSLCSENISSPQTNRRLPNTFAANTLPEGLFLKWSNLPNAVYGVFATREIKKDTIFGPYVGTRNFDIQFSNNSGRLWKIFMNNKLHHYIDGQDPETSNWMRYVNPDGQAKLQNLESFQYGYKIYYRAIVDIQDGSELLVWYSEDYNQDCLDAGGDLKKLISDKTSLIHFGNKCQDFGNATLNDDAPAAVTSSVTREKDPSVIEDITKKTPAKIRPGKQLLKCVLFNARRSDLKTHKSIHSGKKPYKCDVCNAAFAQSSVLRRHAKTHSGVKPYKCGVCSAAFAQNNVLRRHMRTHTGEKPYKCAVCEAAFAQSGSLKTHMRNHTGEKPFKCDVCEAAFAKSSDLKTHSWTHTGEKPYKCDVCDATYARSGDLRRHKWIHTREKPYKCGVCNATFTLSSDLRTHTMTHTVERPHKCYICNSSFARSDYLRRHKRTHTGEKPYKCGSCSAAFAQSSALRTHAMTHTGVKPYKCDDCNASFTRNSDLKRHKKSSAHKKDSGTSEDPVKDITS